MAARRSRDMLRPRSKFSASSMVLFWMPISAACATAACNASSFWLPMASAKALITCKATCFALPAPEPSRAAVLTRGSVVASGFCFAKSSRKAMTLDKCSLGSTCRAPPRNNRTSTAPAGWKPSHSLISEHSDTSQVVMLATTTQSRLALVRATFRRRQSATKPTSPRRLARTRLTMITSFSHPWKASTDETCTAPLAAAGRVRRISATCAAYGVMMPISSPVSREGKACRVRSTSQATQRASSGFTLEAPLERSSASTCRKPSGAPMGSFGDLCLSASFTPLRS
mmetsp:Transcript_59695/g.194827  ORF Transcript_59695/g.194827 Transcript_59695/m.194827 type:complete len:285 (-) Transcript_59695:2246-3100(-)